MTSSGLYTIVIGKQEHLMTDAMKIEKIMRHHLPSLYNSTMQNPGLQ